MNRFSSLAAELRGNPRLTAESAREIRSVRSLTGTSMLMALSVLLNQFTIFISALIRVSFTFLPIAAAGMLFGPVLTGLAGAAIDILKYFTRNDGSAFFPGFTISEFMRGFLYGLILYRKPVTLGRTAAAHLSVMMVVTFLLNPLWLSMMYGQAFVALVGMRVIKNLFLFPIEVAMLYALLKATATIRARALV